jgi:putative ABC transport system permease protein
MVFTEIPADQAAAFDQAVAREAGPLGPDAYLRMPFVTGRIAALKGAPVRIETIKPGER